MLSLYDNIGTTFIAVSNFSPSSSLMLAKGWVEFVNAEIDVRLRFFLLDFFLEITERYLRRLSPWIKQKSVIQLTMSYNNFLPNRCIFILNNFWTLQNCCFFRVAAICLFFNQKTIHVSKTKGNTFGYIQDFTFLSWRILI